MSDQSGGGIGVEIIGSALHLPEGTLTNKDLEGMMDTSDEWIVKRTGINTRRRADIANGETTSVLATEAMRKALANAKVDATELDLLLVATMTCDSPTPSVGCVVAREVGCRDIGAMDINAACSGFLYTVSMADAMIKSGTYKTIGVIGADCITRHIDYSNFGRGAAILFGDGAGAMVLRATDDSSKGMISHKMHADGNGAKHLFIPSCEIDFPEEAEFDERKLDKVQMNGQAVFKFAVTKFQEVISETLEESGLSADDIDHFVCHQANSRILDSARERFGIPSEKLLVNIQKYGNTVGGSIPIVFHELVADGKVQPGQKVMFLAFGAGLTWGSSLWQL
ncbi:MAG: ketoacyl-ACP synthase III [Phycisphaerales bacterium]|jgi:3-oxoacyl-[acyl-carrier-protein] synthase III|nr:ketoacyl-ACP synthase III [Phycisphaerales bacterium]